MLTHLFPPYEQPSVEDDKQVKYIRPSLFWKVRSSSPVYGIYIFRNAFQTNLFTVAVWQARKVRPSHFINEEVVSTSLKRSNNILDTGKQSQRAHRPLSFYCPLCFEGSRIKGLSPFPVQRQCGVFHTEILPPGPLVSRRTVSWS